MPKAKAIAIAAIADHPFRKAVQSAHNALHGLGDMLYGTPERSRLTYMLAIAMYLMGMSMGTPPADAMQVCGF